MTSKFWILVLLLFLAACTQESQHKLGCAVQN